MCGGGCVGLIEEYQPVMMELNGEGRVFWMRSAM